MYKDFESVSSDVTELNAIKNSIRNILLTKRGSLPGKPRFGSDLYKIVFSQLDPLTESIAKNYINEALAEYEDRISVTKVTIRSIEEFNKMVITIYFSYENEDFSASEYEESVSLSIGL